MLEHKPLLRPRGSIPLRVSGKSWQRWQPRALHIRHLLSVRSCTSLVGLITIAGVLLVRNALTLPQACGKPCHPCPRHDIITLSLSSLGSSILLAESTNPLVTTASPSSVQLLAQPINTQLRSVQLLVNAQPQVIPVPVQAA